MRKILHDWLGKELARVLCSAPLLLTTIDKFAGPASIEPHPPLARSSPIGEQEKLKPPALMPS